MTFKLKVPSSQEAAARKLAAMGFFPSAQPGARAPQDPFILGELGPDELMELFAQFTAWANYASTKVAEAESEEEDIESDLELAKARFMINENAAGEDKVTWARAKRDTDAEVVRLSRELRRIRAVRKMLSTHFASYERTTAMLSRELTRRQIYMPYERRSGP